MKSNKATSYILLHLCFNFFIGIINADDSRLIKINKNDVSHGLEDNTAMSDSVRFKRNEVSKIGRTDLLINEPNCIKDLNRLCSNLKPNTDDLTVLECIQSFKGDVDLSTECQQLVWKRTALLMDFDHLSKLMMSKCNEEDWQLLAKDCKNIDKHSRFLSCIIDNYERVKNVACQTFVHEVQLVAFSDFRLISDFTESCVPDIEKFGCGRIQRDYESLSQGQTMSCLQQKIEELTNGCKQQVLHFSGIQEIDIRFDRPLYVACSEETQRFCEDVKPGTGQMYKCLMQHKLDRSMSDKCEAQLFKHEKMISQDYRVSKGLARSCREYIRTFRCRRSVSEDKAIRLAQILLCLETNMKNGSKVSHDCQIEMMEHRKILLEDYRLSPEIVSSCSKDIQQFCGGDLEVGKTIHCLLEHSRHKRKKARVSPGCQYALQTLIKETDAGENWRVDPVLRESCKHVVDVACKDMRGGEARVISCLMDHLGTDTMTDACEQALMQIQYFVARDYRLDPQLFRECRDDAAAYCHGKKAWNDVDRMEPELGPLVLPCLYRYVYVNPDFNRENIKLKPGCVDEIRRVMRVRAISVDLQPEIEMFCIKDLADFCYDKTGVGEEMVCLQDRLENLQEECKRQVFNFTQAESDNIELNPIVLQTCRGIIEKQCEAELRSKDAGSVMECLIQNKNERAVRSHYKCRAAIEHFQLITLKDYHFTVKFERACHQSVLRFCPKARTKADVVFCLSELVRNNTISDTRFAVTKDCRQQLKAQLLNQRENVNFDPRLTKACSADIKTYCKDAFHGNSEVLECLKQIKTKLTNECHRYIFATELQDLTDSSTDYTLLNVCKQMILLYCNYADMPQVLPCLKRYKDEAQFEPKCKAVVVHRMIEQSSDYRLNPGLQHSCKKDIDKFCSDLIDVKDSSAIEFEGKVIKCLQLKFIKRKLRLECEQEMAILLREAALNYQLIPVLRTVCENEIKNICGKTDDNLGSGAVLECLKVALLNNKIHSRECQIEVAGLIEEAKADIHVDPLLQRACAIDISKYCTSIPQGAGRHVQCLMAVMADPVQTKLLQSDCHTMLKQRIDMFKNADKLIMSIPVSLEQLIDQVQKSPSKKYFTVVAMTFIGMIFIVGLFCGRISRHGALMKNK